MKRRFLSMLLCLAMLIGTLPIYVTADEVTDSQNDELQTYAGAADPDPNGEGTVENPYLITSAGELMWFRDKVNGGDNSISARLMGDIRIDNEDGWTAIGSSANPYNGTFDGNNYSIDTASGKMWTMASDDKSILFGYIGGSGVIKSLNMKWVQVIAVDNAAVIAYENDGTIEQCSIKTILNNSEATESFCGFAYTNNGTIKNCLSILRGQYKNTCGFVHTNNGTIESSLCSFEQTTTIMDEDTDSVYAIAKESTGTITNCYCTCTYHSGIVKDTGNVQKVYTDADGLRYDSANGKAVLLKKIAWLLNNNGSTEGSSTDPWRYGEDVNGANHKSPTLDPTDQKVTKSDGSETVIPHTHRVDGIIREFTCGDIYRGGEYIYFDSDNSLVNELIVEENMTVCLNGHNLNINLDSIVVPSGINFTVTDCQETAGTVTSGGNAGVTVDGGTFVLDNANISNCTVGIDYKSGTVKLSGKARVKDNTTNIKLAENQKLSFGILDKSAHFGVTYDGNIAVGGEVEITDKTGAKYASQLSSDNEEYVIANGGGAVVLKHPTEHSHCICGADHKEISGTDENKTTTGHTAEESVGFKPWNPNSHRDSENRPTLPTNEGSYYLTENADLKDGAWEPNSNVTLCLNGHTVTFDNIKDSSGHDIGTVWLDGEDDNLTVTDCGTNGTITMSGAKQNCVRITKGGVFNLYGGTMKGFSRAVSIGDISELDQYRGYGTFNMYGGTLTENTYAQGAAVYGNHKDAKVVMYGGKIINNKSALIGTGTTQGGGVCVKGGSFTMYNGEISGNGQADTTVLASKQAGTMFGGGVYVNGTFKMYSGKIADNTVETSGDTLAAYGGGVCARDTFEMYGGEISGNTVKKGYGGGVYINNSGSSPCIKNATILRNKVEEQQGKLGEGGGGGGIYYYSYHHSTEAAIPLTLENTTVADNSLHANVGDSNRYGGGAGVFGTTDIIIDRCVISGNVLTGKNGQTDSETSEPIGAIGGAGVCVPSANLTIKNSKIVGNKAITDDGAADNRKLVSGGVLFCDSRNKFTVSGNVNISGNTVDGADGNVYLEKMTRGSAEQTKQNQITVDTLAGTSKIGVTAKTAPTGSTTVTVATSENEIPDDIFTSDKIDYKAVLADDKKSVYLTENTDVAEVIHSDGTKTAYDNILDAIESAQDGETVKVLKDNCSINNGGHNTFLKKNITLDLNDKTVKTDELIIISGNVTNVAIKNGTIYGTRKHNKDSVLITFQSSIIFNTLTLDNVRVIQTDENNVALYVYCGKLVMADGEIDGGLLIGEYGSAELSGGTFKNTNGAVISDTKTGGGIARFLKSGYAYKKENGTFIDLSANPTLIPIGTTVTVAPCTHGFDSGKCKYCGYVCKHENIDYNNTCTDCGTVLPVLVRDLYNEKIIYGRYSTLEEAFASINKGEARTVVYYGADDHTFENDIEIKGTVYYYSTGGKSLKFNNEKSFVVKDGGALYGTAYGYISAVTLEAGSVYSSESDFVVGTLTVYDGSKILINNKLQNGNFEKIVIIDGNKTVGDILHTTVHRTFRHKGADGSWAKGAWVTDEELGRTTIENVSIVKKPFYNESITADSVLTYKNNLDVTMEAEIETDSTIDYGETTYKWFAADSSDNVLGTNSSYTTTLSVAGTYEFGCRITRGGYTRTVTKQIIVNKATSEYEKEPKAIEELVYDGNSRELVEAGTIGAGQKILYKLDDGDWSEDIPKAANAGVYKVSYKVEEIDNYSGIGEKHFNVTISKRVLSDIVTDTVSKQYNGKKDLPIFSITKFKDSDGNELTLYGSMVTGEYESADVGENKKITLTVTLNALAENYVFDNGTAEKVFEKTGTITKAKAPNTNLGSLTIVRKLKRNYRFDVSKLLGDVPYGMTYGKITYKLDSVDIPYFYDESEKAKIDENGILTLPVQESIGAGDGTVTVKATTDNYKGVSGEDEIILTIQINAMAKIALKNGAPTLNPTSIAYGQKLGNISLSGSLEDYDGNTVKGTFSWKNPDIIPSAGAASGEWIFTPDDDEFYMYETKSGTASFTVEPKDITNAVVTLGESHKYNGSEQTQGITSVTVDGLTLSESDYDISDNKAADVKADGNYVLTITGKGNFNGTKTAEWNIKPTEPTENADKKTTARVRRGRTLAEATVTNGELFGIDGTTTLEGTFAWVDDTKVMNANGTEKMTFTPNNKNYVPITIDVAVSTYSSGGGSSSSSSASSYTVKFETNGGSTVENQTVKKNETVSEPTEPKKDGFEFAGWFTDKELKNEYDFDTKVTKNFTLYAAWTEAKTEPNPNPTDKPESPGSTKPDQTNPEKENPFDDVSKDDWYYDDVKSAVEKGLFNGTGSKIFAPNDSITRGMFVTVLYRAEGEPKVNTAIPFVDVSADSYYANAVIWAEQNEIVNGISETEFAPNENITREQIAAIMFRFAKYKGAAPTGAWAIRLDYADLESVSDYAAEAVMYCTLKGIMQGKDNNLFAPQDSATRAEIAAILNRFLKANK